MTSYNPLRLKFNAGSVTVFGDHIGIHPSSEWKQHIEPIFIYQKQYPDLVLFVSYARESNIINEPVLEFMEIMEQHGIRSVWFLDSGTRQTHSRLNHGRNYHLTDLVFVDYFAWHTYTNSISKPIQGKNNHWNPYASKFLFLTGKNHKPNRAPLLYKFKQRGLLEHCEWSLFVDQTNFYSSSRVPGLTDKEFMEFCQSHHRVIDHEPHYQGISNDVHGNYSNCHYPGFPYNPEIFANTLFRVISETRFDSGYPGSHFITEKTWMTILNHQPFIMASSQHTLWALKQMGFNTFEQYLPVKHYDSISDQEQRLEAIVENTHYWIKHIDNHREQIAGDVLHNFRQYIALCIRNQHKIQSAINKYHLPLDVHDAMPLDYWIS